MPIRWSSFCIDLARTSLTADHGLCERALDVARETAVVDREIADDDHSDNYCDENCDFHAPGIQGPGSQLASTKDGCVKSA